MARIAVILGDGFEDSEFRTPFDRLKAAGHELDVIGSDAGQTVSGKRGDERVRIESSAKDVKAEAYAAMLIPGGHGPDNLRIDDDVVGLVRDFGRTGRPIAAVCHGPQLLIEAELVNGRTMTSWPSVRTDLKNAGATWVDREVVEDGPFITSRNPDDLPAFTACLQRHLG